MSWKTLARSSAARAVRGSGLPGAVRAATRRRATVAFYHDPSPEVLDAHLRFCRDRFRFVAYDLLVDALRTRDFGRIPQRALALTFDDGLAGNHALLPVLRKHGVRPTIFVCTAIVGSERGFWFNEPVETQPLKRVPNGERLAALARATGFEPDAPRPGPRQALSRDEILDMADHVDFGSHTRTHPILPQCSDEEALEEIEGSRHDLERLLGRPCRHFCPPNGAFGEREAELARKAGYESLRTTDTGFVGPRTDPFAIPVAGISDDASLDMFVTQLSGLPRFVKNLAQGRLGGATPPI